MLIEGLVFGVQFCFRITEQLLKLIDDHEHVFMVFDFRLVKHIDEAQRSAAQLIEDDRRILALELFRGQICVTGEVEQRAVQHRIGEFLMRLTPRTHLDQMPGRAGVDIESGFEAGQETRPHKGGLATAGRADHRDEPRRLEQVEEFTDLRVTSEENRCVGPCVVSQPRVRERWTLQTGRCLCGHGLHAETPDQGKRSARLSIANRAVQRVKLLGFRRRRVFECNPVF